MNNTFIELMKNYRLKIDIKKMIGYKSKLRYKWTLWFHNLYDNNWLINSYQKIYSFNNIYDFWRVYNNHGELNKGMFFLMKNDIEPLWESEENKNGGTFSIKIMKNSKNRWLLFCIDLISGNMDKKNIINGLSIVYKKTYYIIKIWINNKKYNNIENINIDNKYKNNIIYNNFK